VIWVAHDIRDAVVDFVRYWSELTELPVRRFLEWIELSPRKFGRWQQTLWQAIAVTVSRRLRR
jgi:putative transposase